MRGGVVPRGLVGHLRELRQNIAQIVVGVDPELPAGLEQGVVDRAGLSGIGTAEEEPVLFPDSGGSNGVFDEIVVDLHFAMLGVDEKFFPEIQRVADRFAGAAFGKVVLLIG